MAGTKNLPPPAAEEAATTVNAGEAESPLPGPVGAGPAAAEEVDFDLRESRIKPERKAMGPPLVDSGQPVTAAATPGEQPAEVGPTDPEDVDPDDLNADR